MEDKTTGADGNIEREEGQDASQGALSPDAAGTCYSGKGCTGKVLNHRDRHNCKQSGGKSWRGPDGKCYPV